MSHDLLSRERLFKRMNHMRDCGLNGGGRGEHDLCLVKVEDSEQKKKKHQRP